MGTLVATCLEHLGGGRSGACSPCAHTWAGSRSWTDPSTRPGHRPLTLPPPAKACHFSCHFCHHQRQEVGLVLPPLPTFQEPWTPWVVPGTELEALTQPITCAAIGGSSRSKGPRDHTGGSRGVQGWAAHTLPGTRSCTAPGLRPDVQRLSSPAALWGLPPRWPSEEGGQHALPHHWSPLPLRPADSLLLGCFHLSWDVLFIALTLYFEVLPLSRLRGV